MCENCFDRYVKQDDEKPSIGILLCHSKKDELVELTLAKDTNIHASEYQLYISTKEKLRKQIRYGLIISWGLIPRPLGRKYLITFPIPRCLRRGSLFLVMKIL